MTIVDKFPAPGDTGVAGADRGTEWATAPTLAGPATYTGPSPAPSSTRPARLRRGRRRGRVTTPIGRTPPGRARPDCGWWPIRSGAVPARRHRRHLFHHDDAARRASCRPDVAWNSIAHSEATDVDNGRIRKLAPLEPLKVGVATMYGNLQVTKEIGDNPADLPLDDVEFTFAYDCATAVTAVAVSGPARSPRRRPHPVW